MKEYKVTVYNYTLHNSHNLQVWATTEEEAKQKAIDYLFINSDEDVEDLEVIKIIKKFC